MTNRFPLIVDEATGRLKELPIGDSLDLTGSAIVAADSLEVNGEANVEKLTIGTQTIDPSGTPGANNNAPLAVIAFTGDYNDLANLPNSGFSGSYNDLSDTPIIPSTIRDLNEVSVQNPQDRQALVWNSTANEYQPQDVVLDLDLSSTSIRDLFDVSYTLAPDMNSVLKYSAGAWRPSKVQYAEVQNKPTNVSFFANDAGYITADAIQEIQGDFQGSVFADDSTLLVDGVAGKIVGNVDTSLIENTSGNLNINASNYVVIDSTDNGQIEIGRSSGVGDVIIGNSANGTDINLEGNVTFASGTTISGIQLTDIGITDGTSGQVLTTDGAGNFTFQNPGDQIGNFTLSSSIIDTDDSSAITITPALVVNSDLTVENDVTVDGTVTASRFVATGEGDPEFSSETDITLNAAERVTIISSPLKFASFSTAERDNLSSENGDVIYNSSTNKFQGYANGSWVDLH